MWGFFLWRGKAWEGWGRGERGVSGGPRARGGRGSRRRRRFWPRPARPTHGVSGPSHPCGGTPGPDPACPGGVGGAGTGGSQPSGGGRMWGVGASPGRAGGARLVLSRARVLFGGGQDRGDGHADPPSLCLRTQASQLGGDGRSGPHPRRLGERGQLGAFLRRVQTGFPTQKIGRLHRSRPPCPRR